MSKPIILGLCTANRCRSQMFEAILRHLAGDSVEALSAGMKATFVHPLAIKVLEEIDVPVVNQTSKKIDRLDPAQDLLLLQDQNNHLIELSLSRITHVITLCGSANDTCPFFPGNVVRDHWPIDDPDQYEGTEEEILPYFRASRDDIWQRVNHFLKQQL